MNTTSIILKKRPQGRPQESDFEYRQEELPKTKEGQVRLKLKYLSVDPYLRGRMSDSKSYVEPFKLDEPIESLAVAEITESKNEDFKKGDHVVAELPWTREQNHTGENLNNVNNNQVSYSAYLGILGMTGLTAYFGLTEIGKPKEGETMVVSGAAGAVGSTVGQLGKIMGCKVVGIAGSNEKIDMITKSFGFDAGINYKTTEDMKQAIAETCPDGVDIYFDNVGGEISDALLFNLNQFSRTINCGAIAVYNDTELPTSVSVRPFLIKKSALMQGFIVSNYSGKFDEGRKELSNYLKQGKLNHEETIIEGFDNVIDAFLGLFDGDNKGKMVVKI